MKWFENLKIAQKIIGFVILAGIFIFIVGSVGYEPKAHSLADLI